MEAKTDSFFSKPVLSVLVQRILLDFRSVLLTVTGLLLGCFVCVIGTVYTKIQ